MPWVLIAAGVFAIGLAKSGFGSGLGLLVVPIIMMAAAQIPGFGPAAGLGLMLPLLIAGDVIAVLQNFREFDRRSIVHLLPGMAVGVVAGGGLLWWFHQSPPALLAALIKIEVGMECLLLSGMHYWRHWRGIAPPILREPARGILTGAFAGVSSTLAHAAGPIVAMYLLPLGLSRRSFVGTSALFFLLLNTAKLPAYAASQMFSAVEFSHLALLLPILLAGATAGAILVRRLSDRTFTQVVYAATVVTGFAVLLDGLSMIVLER